MRFIHTADWQIGMKAKGLEEAGSRVREERLAAVQRVVEVAKQKEAEFILVAGDVFEDNGVDRRLIQKVGDILARFEGPVFIIPGNHDPAVPGSVWEHSVWGSADNLHVLIEEEPVEIIGGFLHPCPALEKYSSRDPTAWIKEDHGELIRIGLAHGTVEGVRQDEPDYPIPLDAPGRYGLDYLALGHWHSTAFYEGSDGAVRIAYSGTHETSKFGERDSGNVLLVEIAQSGAPPVIERIRSGGLNWEVIEQELRNEGELTELRERIEAFNTPDSTLLEVRLSGVLAAAEREDVDRIDEILQSRFLYGRIDTAGLLPAPEDDSWLSGLPVGVLRETATRLREMAASESVAREADTTRQIAALALMELYAIAGESCG